MAISTIDIGEHEVTVFSEKDGYLCDEDVIAILDEAAAKVRGTVPSIISATTTEVPEVFYQFGDTPTEAELAL